MKKCLLFFVCFCFSILAGCWDRQELQDLAIITAAAIDKVEDGKTKISVQIFIPRSITSGQTGEDPSLGSTFVREGTGDNLAQAISMLQINIPRRIFWGQCKIFIFGNELAKNGIRKTVDFLVRHPGPRGNSLVYVSEKEAVELLTLVPPLERYSGEALRKLTQEEYGMMTTLRDVDMGLMDESESVSIPYIKMLNSKEPARKSHETIPVIAGTAIFKKDKMVGNLNLSETRGLLWLKDEVKNATVSVEMKEDGGDITMTPTIGKIKYRPQIKDNRWIMNLNILVEGDIVQNETHLNLMNEDIIKQINKEYQSVLEERVAQTARKLQEDFQADVIGMGRRFHQKYPMQWRKVASNWDEKFKEVEVNVVVHANIRKPGYIGPPAALPREEVEE